MRKLALLLAVVMLFGTIGTFTGYATESTVTVADDEGNSENAVKYYINEDFSSMSTEDLNRNYWSLTENYGKAEIVDDTVKHIGSTEGKVLEMSYVAGTTTKYTCAPHIIRSLPRTINSGKMVIEWRAMYEYAANNTFTLTSMVDGVRKSLLDIMVSVRGIQFSPGPVYSDNIVPGEYADYKLVLDMDGRSYDFYINNIIKLEDMAFYENVDEFSRIETTAWCEGHGNAAWSYSYLKVYSLDEKVSDENEIIPEEYVKANGLLNGLGALETVGAASSINEVLTRGRYALLMAGALGKPDSELGHINSTVFTDVPASNEYKRAVGFLNMLGIAKTDTHFEPDRDVTLLEAVVMAIRALGYENTIFSSGNYAQEYMTVALRLGLLDGLKAENPNSTVIMGDAMRLMYNMLHVDVVKQEIWSELATYASYDGRTMLKTVYNIDKYNGRITANEFSGISNINGAVGVDSIEIDGQRIFKITDAAYKDLLGYNVDFYADAKEKICYYAYPDDCDTIEVHSEDIISATEAGNTLTLSYESKSGKIKKAMLSNKSDILLNGVSKGRQITSGDLMPPYGSVTIVKNKDDEGTSFVRVENLEEYVFDTYLSDTIYTLDGTRIKLKDYKIMKGTQSIDPTELTEGSVLTVKRVTDDKIEIRVSQNDDFGMIESVTEDTLTVNGKEYELSPYYAGADESELVPGADIMFYIGESGKILYIDDDSVLKSSQKDGYLLAVAKGDVFQELCKFRIIDPSEGIQYYKTAKKFTIDGVRYTNGDNIINKLRQTSQAMKTAGFTEAQRATLTGNETDQLIRYKCNRNMEITEIITDYWKVSGPRIAPPSGTTNLYNYDSGGALISGMYNDYSVHAFGVHDSKTLLIEVPGINLEDDRYITMKWSDVASDKWKNDYLVFNADDHTRVAEAVISYDDSDANRTIPDASSIKLVTEVSSVMTDDEDIVHEISYIEGGKEQTIKTKDHVLAAEVETGDILRWVTNKDGVVVYLERYDITGYQDASDSSNYSSWGNIRIGSIVGYEDNYYGVLTRPASEGITEIIRPIYIKDTMDVTLFDKTTGDITITEHKELRNYTQSINPDARIIVFESHGTPSSIYLIY